MKNPSAAQRAADVLDSLDLDGFGEGLLREAERLIDFAPNLRERIQNYLNSRGREKS